MVLGNKLSLFNSLQQYRLGADKVIFKTDVLKAVNLSFIRFN